MNYESGGQNHLTNKIEKSKTVAFQTIISPSYDTEIRRGLEGAVSEYISIMMSFCQNL